VTRARQSPLSLRRKRPTITFPSRPNPSRSLSRPLHDRCRAIASGAEEPRGPLRVNANIPFAVHCVVPLIPRFLARHPYVTLDLSLTDATVDLIDERADVAIRTGPLRDSGLKARKLMESRRLVVGAPAYFAAHGRPRTPEDLARHNCLNFNFRYSADEWPFRVSPNSASGTRALPVHGNLTANNGETVRQLALAGLGIARLSVFHIGRDVAEGLLEPVLEEYNPGDAEAVHAVYVGHEHLSNRIRAFVTFLVEQIPAWDAPP